LWNIKLNNSNVIRTEKELAQLLQELLGKKDDGFVFRGHADSRWELRPKLFRAQEEIAKSWEDSGLTREYIQKNWFEHVDTLSKLGLCFGNISLKRANYQGVLVLHKGQSIPLIRLLWLYVDIMKYNYNLCQYTSDNRNYYPDQYLENQKDRTPDFWKSCNVPS
jgi:hypothetical protein